MAKDQQEKLDLQGMTDQQMLEELTKLYGTMAGKSLSSILGADIEITDPRIREITAKEVEYSILEPAIFVKSCLTSNVAGNIVLILRQRDMQAFLNELMGIDDLPDPDFVFDEVAMSAATELMNQMARSSVSAMAEYFGDTMESSDCQLVLSDGQQYLSQVMGEDADSRTVSVQYHMQIKDMVETEFIACISETALDSLHQELEAKQEAEAKRKAEEEAEPGLSAVQEASKIAVGGVASLKKDTSRTSEAMHKSITVNPAIQKNLGLIMDVPLSVSVEIGKTRRRLKDVLNFNNGTVIELDKEADEPVDIIVNGQLIARGEVVVIDDNFGVRISEIINTKSIIGNGESI